MKVVNHSYCIIYEDCIEIIAKKEHRATKEDYLAFVYEVASKLYDQWKYQTENPTVEKVK